MSEQSDSFLYPNDRDRGEFQPKDLAFNSNLQEFTQKISYICSLETAGKLTPLASYQQIKTLWQELKRSKTQLGIGQQNLSDENGELGK
ncbi:hypothetical protein [Chamaesiphon sp. VAR_69_metabat_338]|uniref:DUF7219 family protein n=1 Tax=Chamaesiphon sp. VAR_69_metabat_338 TaxID=2964704 RepID=UPI00286DD886|nr:hypothetical protein [Chamaesiphon sp. VAR_69_metabat_338]